jgi:signal transduction histidine kinase
VLTVAAGLIGTLFGRVTSRGLVRRLENLERVSEAWGQGDFSATVDDTSPDEIGQLARRMSQMAGQIQDLLQARQDLAALEERNRLARDLHDSVKQQAFATTMTLGTAKTLREQDTEAAWEMIDEAEDLSWQVQQELTGLIHELRPVELEGKRLAAALQEYGSRWSRQTGIEVSVALRGEHPIVPEVEQALFRLAQEALANVSKHAEARHVDITLVCTESAITLKVADDGLGFDPAAAEGQGLGLRSMRERLESLGGELTVESAQGTGTRLVARTGLE